MFAYGPGTRYVQSLNEWFGGYAGAGLHLKFGSNHLYI